MRQFLAVLVQAAFATALVIGPAGAVVGPSTEGGPLAAHTLMILKREGRAAGFCSGVVIARNVVLTAAHCMAATDNMKLHYRNAAGTPVLLAVAQASVHPDYHADAQRTRVRSIDLALVMSAEPLPGIFTPAQLDSSGEVAVGDAFVLAGYGLAREGEGKSGGTLRIGALEARAPLSKILLWAKDRGNSHTGACTGDSGAPIFDGNGGKVVAIADWVDGYSKALCGSLTQGPLVAPQRGWIDMTLQRWGLEPLPR